MSWYHEIWVKNDQFICRIYSNVGLFVVECSLLHLPYNDASLPFSSELSLCSFCRSAKVHDVLLATCELSSEMTTVGDPVVVHANVVKKKKRGHGEAEAMELKYVS